MKRVLGVHFIDQKNRKFEYTGKTVVARVGSSGAEVAHDTDLSEIGYQGEVQELNFEDAASGTFRLVGEEGLTSGYSKGDNINFESNVTLTNETNTELNINVDDAGAENITIAHAVYENGADLVAAINAAIEAVDPALKGKVVATWTEVDEEDYEVGYITFTSAEVGVGSSVVVTAGTTYDARATLGFEDPDEETGEGSDAIAHNVNNSTLEAAIEAMSEITSCSVSGGSGLFRILYAASEGDSGITVSSEENSLEDSESDPVIPNLDIVVPYTEKGIEFIAWGE